MDYDDRTLIDHIRNRFDESRWQAACEELYQRCRTAVTIYLRWKGWYDLDIDDISQDVSVKLIHAIEDEQRAIRNLEAYTRRTVHNTCADAIRVKLRDKHRAALAEMYQRLGIHPPGHAHEMIDMLVTLLPRLQLAREANALWMAFLDCWQGLRNDYRQILNRYILGRVADPDYSYSMIARELEVSRTLVGVHLHRARRGIQRCMQSKGIDLQRI